MHEAALQPILQPSSAELVQATALKQPLDSSAYPASPRPHGAVLDSILYQAQSLQPTSLGTREAAARVAERHQAGAAADGAVEDTPIDGVGSGGAKVVVDHVWALRVAGLRTAEGMAAYRQGDFAGAVSKLLPVRQDWVHLGGSTVQRDVFGQTLLQAAINSGQLLLARALARERYV